MIKLWFQVVDKYVEVAETIEAQQFQPVENLVEVVDNSPYQDLYSEL